jgi:acyl-coenzyme A synthetase/AMP-(fatty) acid ligase
LQGHPLTTTRARRPDYAATASDDPAYLVFTSGTTNHPKGVLHAHRVVLGRLPMQADGLGLTPNHVVLHAGDKRPRRWVMVDHMDRTANGKVNRKALVRRAG